MRALRTAALVVTALAGPGLAACSSATTATTTTSTGRPSAASSGASTPTSPAAIGSGSAALCAEVATFTSQLQGLVTAGRASGSAPEHVGALRDYARRTKVAFDQLAPRITADLASAPGVVQTAWSSLQPQVDQLLASGESASGVAAFDRTAAAVESSNGYAGASQTLDAFTHGACRTALPT